MSKSIWPWLVVLAAASLGTEPVLAGEFNQKLAIGGRAPDWSNLMGADGARHGLADYRQAKLVVLVFVSHDCPVAQAYVDRLNELEKTYAPRGVAFVALDVSKPPADTPRQNPTSANREPPAVKNPYRFDCLFDTSQAVGRAYGATVTPEAFVLDADRKLAYLGAIDDRWSDAEHVTQPYVRLALESLLSGKAPATAETKPIGCGIDYED
jgi:thiol-disulfide isomerase/thioredoxin